jgi:hypothetical protein
VLSSFGTVENVSVSGWRPLLPRSELTSVDEQGDVLGRNKSDVFNARGALRRSALISADDLCGLSFYAFHRQFYYMNRGLHRRRCERFVSVSGAGFPAQAARAHVAHERYAQQTLYAYMPCAGLRGLDYVDERVASEYGGSFAIALRAFLEDATNLWCPTWIRKNYEFLNRGAPMDTDAAEASATVDIGTGRVADERSSEPTTERRRARPRTEVLEDEPLDGEPPVDEEETRATTLDHWDNSARPAWERHSELGCNLDPLGRDAQGQPWIPNINPPDFAWDARWPNTDVDRLRRLLLERSLTDVETDMPDLSREALGDDFQRLFVEVVRDYVDRVQRAAGSASAPMPPLRLMLLGTAGTGKTHALQTLLQELKRTVLPPLTAANSIRVAAPTGCAAFNVRFGASTLHRLFDIRNPHRWESLPENSKRLLAFQEKLRDLLVLIFDEVSMIGRQLMGKVDSRCEQAFGTRSTDMTPTLGGKACVLVGDPAQCPPIADEVFFATGAHADTAERPDTTRVTLSNRGRLVFETFQEAIVLQHCHRIRRIAGSQLTEDERAYNDRGRAFLEVVTRLRDCSWTEADYYALCRRKLGSLSLAERAAFVDAPRIMEFRRERPDDRSADTCEAFNRRLLYALAKDSDVPVARFTACHGGVDQSEGMSYDERLFAGLPALLELCEGAPVLLTQNLWADQRNARHRPSHRLSPRLPARPRRSGLSPARRDPRGLSILRRRTLLRRTRAQTLGSALSARGPTRDGP